MKKVLSLLLIVAMAVCAVACAPVEDNTQTNDAFVAWINELLAVDTALTPLDGSETEIKVLYNNAVVPKAGYVDKYIDSFTDKLTSYTSKDGIYQYFQSKAIYNECVKNGVNVNYLDWGWSSTLTQKLAAAFISGDVPDVIIGENQVVSYKDQGLLQAFPEELSAWIKQNCLEASYKQMMDEDGNIYGVAFGLSATMLVWNKNILRLSGVEDYYIDNAPETWDKFLEICEKVKNAGYDAGGVYCGADDGGYLRSYPFINMNGGSITDKEGNIVINSAENEETLQFFRDMSQYTQKGLLTYSEESINQIWFNQKTMAYVVDGAWRVDNATQYGMNSDDVGIGELPAPEGKESSTTLIGCVYFCVPKQASFKDAAFTYIKALLSESVQKQVATFNLRVPVLSSIAESDYFKETSPAMYETYKVISSGNVFSLHSYTLNNVDIWKAYGNLTKKSIVETTPISTLLTEAEAAIGKLL